MGFGDYVAKGISSLYPGEDGDPSRAAMGIQAGGKIFDYYQARKQAERDEEIERREIEAQRRILQQQMNMAQRRAQEETALRQGIVSRAQLLEQALANARQAMGQAPTASQDDINRNYQQIRETMVDDYYNTLDRVSSQGFADAIAKGMDRSDRFRDTQRELGQQSAEELRKIDQEAYNAAINRTQANLDTIYSGREKRLGEIGGQYKDSADILKGVLPSNAGTLFENTSRNQGAFVRNARTNAADSRTAVGTLEGDISKNVAPNVGYMLGKTDKPTNSSQAEIESLKKQISDLQKRNNLLVGNSNRYSGAGGP
tara:strand:+ start:629 stop:1570 length:942 start_codon:yes stop_codon:yes gene_type:complete